MMTFMWRSPIPVGGCFFVFTYKYNCISLNKGNQHFFKKCIHFYISTNTNVKISICILIKNAYIAVYIELMYTFLLLHTCICIHVLIFVLCFKSITLHIYEVIFWIAKS